MWPQSTAVRAVLASLADHMFCKPGLSRRHFQIGRGVGLAVGLLGAGLLAGCGATLNPGLENGLPTNDSTAQLVAPSADVSGDGVAAPAASAKAKASLGTTGLGAAGSGTQAAVGQASGAQASGAQASVAQSSVAQSSVALPKAAESVANASTPGAASYRIGPLDVLEVAVFKVPELNRTVQVGDQGTVNLPLVNEMVAVGKTPQQFERELTSKLGAKYLQSPQVTVNVREFNSQRITVEGAVKNPGVIAMKGRTTLLQVMAQSGGIDSTVATNEVVVFRVRDGKRFAAKFDVGEIRTGNIEDPVLIAGDVVVVNTSDVKSAFNNFLKAMPLASFLLLL
jgi:polysaccharide biosynthesis/export protein